MLNAKSRKQLIFCLTSWGWDFKSLRVIPKPFQSIVLCGKYHTMVNSSGKNLQQLLITFRFFCPFSEVFLSGSVCVQLVTFPSFAHRPSLKKFTEKRCEIRKRNFLSFYYVQWEPVQKRTQAEIRPAHERIRGDEFHSILETTTH